MDWTDDAIVLSARAHGESSLIVQLLTPDHGRHAGLVRGGASRKQRPVFQPGNSVRASWRARMAEHLGTLSVELQKSLAGHWIDDRLRLAGISAACAVAEAALPERAPSPVVYHGLAALLNALSHDDWGAAYVAWEIGVLSELGFGLDLQRCAVTGQSNDLVWVSPKSGRAVSRSAGEAYADRLLRLPDFLNGGLDRVAEGPEGAGADWTDISDGLRLSGYFLERHVFGAQNRAIPAARERFADSVRQKAGIDDAGDSDVVDEDNNL